MAGKSEGPTASGALYICSELITPQGEEWQARLTRKNTLD